MDKDKSLATKSVTDEKTPVLAQTLPRAHLEKHICARCCRQLMNYQSTTA
jgi:hypothetical protein